MCLLGPSPPVEELHCKGLHFCQVARKLWEGIQKLKEEEKSLIKHTKVNNESLSRELSIYM